MKELEVGQKVMLLGTHPWQGHLAIVIRLEKIQVLGKVRPRVRLVGVPDQECFIMRDDQMELVK